MVDSTAERDACRPARNSSVNLSRRLRAAALPVEIPVHGGMLNPMYSCESESGAGADGDGRLPCPAERGGGGRS